MRIEPETARIVSHNSQTVSAPKPIRVLVADDHLVLRLGLITLVQRQPDMEVVAQASNGQQVVALFRQHRPDVTLMDLRMPGMSGGDAIAAICHEFPAARIIVLTIHRGDEAAYQALRAGARGYLIKDVPVHEILAAIRVVHQGGQCIPSEVAGRLVGRMQQADLTPGEIAVLKLVARGFSNKQIAVKLAVSDATARSRVASILAKLTVKDRTHAVTLALDRGIIDLEDVEAQGPPEA
jgi:two-component system, NarL family, response regulator